MSKLGNLFGGGGNSDSNDSLKYSAPKEPKAAKAVVASTPTKAATDSFKAPVQNTVPAKAVGPSKIMASATVRLYKINPATNAYDAVDNGSQLGCVIMGSGTTFQILIYNGQKLSQATIAITASTDYSVRDLYMSLSDAMGNAWSILFDSAEVMNHCLRTIVATIAHLASHSETPIAWETFQRSLQGSDETGEDALAAGMSAGLYLTLWELGDLADYPGDVVSGRPLRQVAAPDEVIKIKISSAEEVLPGLTTALKGYKKGDRFLFAISPKVAYRAVDTNAFVDMSVRQHPGSWLLCEVEVAKIKSGEGAKDKKNKKPAEVAAPTASPASQQQSQYTNSDIDYEDASSSSQQPGGGSDLKDRMARMAKSSGGGSMVNTGGARRGSHGSNSSDHHSSDDPHQHSHDRNSDNNSINNTNHSSNHSSNNHNYNNNSANNQHVNFDNRNHNDRNDNFHHNNGNNNHGNNSRNQEDFNRSSDGTYDRHRHNNYNNDRNNDRNYNNHNSGRNNNQQSHNNRYSSSNNEYAVALVAGQESRSYYDSSDHDHDLHNRGANERKPAPAAAASVVVAADTSALQQSMMIVQQSMMQLHTKLDQVGAQVSSSFSLQQQMQAQQQAVVPAASPTGAAFGANPYAAQPANPYALNAMGLNPMQQQFQAQQQQQMQLLQMQQAMAQQQQQQLPFNSLLGAGGVSGGSGLRLKSEELVSSLQFIVSEYEALRKDAGSSAKTSEYAEQVSTLRSNVARLEEKNESLLARNEKLMTEKSALLEKQADMIQSGSNSSNKLYAMQSEVEALRRDKAALQSEVDGLRQSQSDARTSERDRAQLQELTSQVTTLQNEVVDLRGRNQDLLFSQQQAASDAQSKLGRANDEVYSLQTKLQDALERLDSATASAAALSAPRTVDFDSVEVQQYVAGRVDAAVSELHVRLSGVESDLQVAREATAAERAVSEDLRSEAADWKAKFSALQAEWASSSGSEKERADRLEGEVADLQLRIAAAGSSPADGRASPEELKAVMQDIYAKACEVFGTDDPDQDAVFAPKEVAKKLRTVLKSVTSERNS